MSWLERRRGCGEQPNLNRRYWRIRPTCALSAERERSALSKKDPHTPPRACCDHKEEPNFCTSTAGGSSRLLSVHRPPAGPVASYHDCASASRAFSRATPLSARQRKRGLPERYMLRRAALGAARSALRVGEVQLAAGAGAGAALASSARSGVAAGAQRLSCLAGAAGRPTH